MPIEATPLPLTCHSFVVLPSAFGLAVAGHAADQRRVSLARLLFHVLEQFLGEAAVPKWPETKNQTVTTIKRKEIEQRERERATDFHVLPCGRLDCSLAWACNLNQRSSISSSLS